MTDDNPQAVAQAPHAGPDLVGDPYTDRDRIAAGRTRSCAICGGSTGVFRAGLYDDRYGYPGTFVLLRCQSCGHKMLDADFSETELNALYSAWYPRSTLNLDEFKPYEELHGRRAWLNGEQASAFRWVPRGVRVLDIGCGFGETLAYHRARGCDAHGVDADENVLRAAQRFGLNARAGLFDASNYEPGSFDFVTLDQVIEHVVDPRAFLAGVAKVLRPGGTIILSTPNSNGLGARLAGRRWINWHVPYHLHLFSRRSLAILAQRAGLQVESVRTLTSSRWLKYQWMHLFSRPPEGIPSPFWDAERATLIVPPRAVRLAEDGERFLAFQIVTRVADALGVGDNYLCFVHKAG